MDVIATPGLGGRVILIVGSPIFGGVAQIVGDARLATNGWSTRSVTVSALVAREFIRRWQGLGLVVDGLPLVAVFVGGLSCDTSPAATTRRAVFA